MLLIELYFSVTRGFQNVVHDYNILDMPFIGYQFMWFKSRY